MREARTILELLRERGKKGLPLERVYRLLYNPDLFLPAYGHIYRNQGAMTKGTTEETADGMAMDKIKAIIEDVRHERYRWSPARRVYIPKKNGTKRPLGVQSWSDKLVQEVIRLLLDAYLEPQNYPLPMDFGQNEDAIRHCGKSTHHTGLGSVWFIEGDISKRFDALSLRTCRLSLPTGKRIKDERFHPPDQRTPQEQVTWKTGAGIRRTVVRQQGSDLVSPILANLYLDKLD